MIGRRLHLSSVLHRKLAQMPFELAEPVWIEDDDIDLDYHVCSITLRRPGTMAQLHQLVARLHSSLLDRSRPLWEMVVIDGLESGQIAFYSKAHHSGADDKAGVELAKVLYDISPLQHLDHQPALVQRVVGADIKALAARVGGTVNTVVMAMCSGALRRFLKERNLLPAKTLIAMVPVTCAAPATTR
jgi:hypothetical protein